MVFAWKAEPGRNSCPALSAKMHRCPTLGAPTEEETSMIRMFVRHQVTDFTAWKSAYDGFDAERRTMGVTGEAVFQTHDNPDEVTAWHDFETLDAAMSFASSDRLKEVMEGAGVAGQPQVWFATPA